MITDDTDILSPGDWEVILNAAGESRPSVESTALPQLEVSYGFYKNFQITAAGYRQVIKEKGESSISDWGEAGVEVKWLFYQGDKFALATAIGYAFPMSRSSRIRGLVEDIRILSVPLIASHTAGRWQFAGQVSLDWTSSSVNGLGYGALAGYSLTDTVIVMAEIYGEELAVDESDEPDEGVTNWRVGLTWQFTPALALLAAYGGDLNSDLPVQEQLEQDWFLGVQYTPL